MPDQVPTGTAVVDRDYANLCDPAGHAEQFKDSPVGRLPKDWDVKPLEDLVDPARPIVYGILMPGTGYAGGVPVIKVKDIVGGRVRLDELLLTSPAIDYEYRRSRVRSGDLLFTIRGTVGRMATVPPQLENANITQDTARIAVGDATVSFVRQYLGMPEPQRFIGVHTLGVAVQGINLRDVRRIPIAVPPRVEGDKIAEILDTLDEAIRKTEQLIAKLKQVKQGVLHDLLTRGIDDNGEIRDPEHHPEQFKDSQLGKAPACWMVSSVDAEFEITAGIALGPHRAPKYRPWPYLRVANVHRAALELYDIAQLELLPNELSERQLVEGDLLVVEGHANPAEIGRCAMASAEVAGYTFQNHLFRLRAKRVLPAFGLCWMNSAWTQAYWRRECATSSGLNTINRTKLRRLDVLVPPIAEQQLVVERVDAVAGRLNSEQNMIEKLLVLKRGLMDDLLTGRVRVTSLLSEAVA